MKLIAIIPAAPDWFATYRKADHPPHAREPVAAWALIEDARGDRVVRAMTPAGTTLEVADLVGASPDVSFDLEYLPPEGA